MGGCGTSRPRRNTVGHRLGLPLRAQRRDVLAAAASTASASGLIREFGDGEGEGPGIVRDRGDALTRRTTEYAHHVRG